MDTMKGFTLIEIIVVITIMSILGAIVFFVPSTFLRTTRDQERADDTASIARRLEQAFTAQEIGTPSYPSTTQLLADVVGSTRTMKRLSQSVFRTPGASSNSVVAATSNSTTTPAGAGTPSISQYVYQPLVDSSSSAALCTGTTICVRYFLYYRRESDNSIQVIKSLHQQ